MKRIGFFAIIFSIILTSAISSCKEKTNTQSELASTIDTLSNEEIQHFTDAGKKIALTTFESLSGNLKKALKKGGVKEAAEYCNIVAMPLTDSLSRVYQASIKRTSTKLRNPENKANEEELEVMNSYVQQSKEGEELKPVLRHTRDKVSFYAPIKTKQLCLSCHGTIGQELSNENYAVLSDLYPEDQATAYKTDELRGIWSIEMKR